MIAVKIRSILMGNL